MNKLIFSLSMFCLANLAFSASQSCYVQTQNCVDSSPSKVFNGQTFTLSELGISCWKYHYTYNCPLVDTCQSYISNGCIVDTSQNVCTETNSSGKCVSWNKIVNCDSGQSTSGTMITCGNEICKPDANGNMSTCYTADPTSDTDFGQAMAALELANEMGTMKNCYDRRTGAKCSLSDPNDPSKGVDVNCECYFFQGKFVTYKNSFKVWDPSGSSCKIGATFTNCDRVAQDFGNTTKVRNGSKLQSGLSALPTRDIDARSDKGQLNLSLTGNKDNTGINAGNPYVYSFASSSKKFGADGNLSDSPDNWAVQNQKNTNYQLAAAPTSNIVNKDDANAASNQIHWNNGGSQTGQGSTASQSNGSMKIIQNAAKMVSDVLDFGSAFSQTCNAEDQSKMINVGKNHCLFGYDGVPGPENNEWILYTYGNKKTFDYQSCTYQTTFWGSTTACLAGKENYSNCKIWYGAACAACKLDPLDPCPSYCDDLDGFCYGQTLGGRGGQDCGGATGGNNVIFTGKVNCCFPSTISKIITKAAFEQGIGGRPKLSMVRNYVAQFKGIEMCSVDELANNTCNPDNTGLNTASTFQAMCERGITTNELQLIDFSKVDFSEFYVEATKGVNTNSYNNTSTTNRNQSNRVQSSVNTQKQQTLKNLEGKNYFNY